MPRLRWARDLTFSERNRASFPFRQRFSNSIQARIFAHLMHSRRSANSGSCVATHSSSVASAREIRTVFGGLRSRRNSLLGRCPHSTRIKRSRGLAAALEIPWRVAHRHTARLAPPRKADSRRDAGSGRKFRMNIKKLLDLSGRVAIVTGGSVGLGRQMAEGLAEMGANLVLCARKKERCQQTAEELQKLAVRTRALGGDVKHPANVQEVLDATVSEFGGIDILINNAGTSWGAPVEEMRLEHWNKVIETNLTGTFLL